MNGDGMIGISKVIKVQDDIYLRVRFLSIGSLSVSQMRERLIDLFGSVTIYEFSNERTFGLSKIGDDFSILMIVTEDWRRAKMVLRDFRLIIKNNLSYILLNTSNPRSRAELLNFGFDDIFDMNTDKLEISIRMNAHASRQLIYDSQSNRNMQFENFCGANLIRPLHRDQRPILLRLYENMGNVVKYNELAGYDFHSAEFRVQSLTVRIHHLRRKLKNYEIFCQRGVGYMLGKIER